MVLILWVEVDKSDSMQRTIQVILEKVKDIQGYAGMDKLGWYKKS